MLCKGCGRSVGDDALVCAHCGRQLLQTPEECPIPEQTKTPPKKPTKDHLGHRLLWALPVLLVAVVGIVALLLFREPPAPTTKTVYLRTETVEHAYDGTAQNTTTLEYDSQGRLLKVVKPSSSSVAHLDLMRTITYEYDKDRITSARFEDGDNTFLLTYSYLDGNLRDVETEKTKKAGAYIRAKCDLDGYITRLYYYDGNSVYKKYSYTYHPDGQVATCAVEPPLTSDYKLTYSYDPRGNLTEETYETYGEVRQRTTYTYDEADRLILKQEFRNADSQLPTATLELSYETDDDGCLTALRIFKTEDSSAVSLSLRGTPKDGRVELKPDTAPETVPEDLCITVAWDNAGNILEEKVFQNGIYVYYRSYKYQKMTLPLAYAEPRSVHPMWLIDV